MRNEGKWVYSLNEELFQSGYYNTKEECIEAAKEELPDMTIFIGQCETPEFDWNICAEDYIEDIANDLYDQVGEVADCFEVSDNQEKALDEMLKETVEKWIATYNIQPCCYKVVNIEKIIT